MRTVQSIRDKREKLRNDLAIIDAKLRELYQTDRTNESNDDKRERWKEIDGLRRNKELIRGQVEALTYVMNEDYEMSEIDENLSMRTIIYGDWRSEL